MKNDWWYSREAEGEKKMEFDKSRVFSSVNADELKAGDKVMVADTMAGLKEVVSNNIPTSEIIRIYDEHSERRYVTDACDECPFALAYLVERAENCTNCESHDVCGYVQNVSKFACLNRCENWKPKTEQKAEKKIGIEKCKTCKNFTEKFGCPYMLDCKTGWNDDYRKPDRYEQKAEPHYRPFNDSDELVKVWDSKHSTVHPRPAGTMPLIWVKRNCTSERLLIVAFTGDSIYFGHRAVSFNELYEDFTFLDGSICGVEE